MAENISITARLKAVDKMSGPFKKVAGASSEVIDSLKKNRKQFDAANKQMGKFDAFRKLTKQSKGTTLSLKKAKSEAKTLSIEFQKSEGKTKDLKNAHRSAERQVEKLASGMRQTKDVTALMRYEFKQAQDKAKHIGAEFKRSNRETKSLGNQFDKTKAKVNQLKAAQIKETEQLKELRSELDKSGVSTRKFGSEQSKAKQKVIALNNQYEKQAKHLEKIAKIENKVSAAKNKMQKGMDLSANMTVGAFGAQQVGNAVKNALMGPISVAADFEEKMSTVGAVSNATKEQMTSLTEAARSLGLQTSFSATEAADGMAFLGKAGYTTSQIIETMPGLLGLAKAGGADIGTTSDIASNILSSFKMDNSQIGKVSDILAKTATTSNTDLVSLGETMKYVGPVAAGLGIDLAEAAAMAGLLGNAGIQGSQAGTSLRSIISKLAAPTKEAGKLLKSLGVETKDSSGDMLEMVDILSQVAEATEGMGNAEKSEVFTKIAGVEAVSSFQILVDEQSKGILNNYIADLNNSMGEAERIAKKMADNTRGALKAMDSAIESMKITIGDVLLPVIKDLAAWLKTVAIKFEAFAKGNPKLIKTLVFLTAALGGIALVGAPLLMLFASLNSLSVIASYGVARFTGAMDLLKIGSGGATRSLMGLNLAFLANPVFLFIAAIVALCAIVGVLTYKYFEPLKAFFTGFWDGLVEGLGPVREEFAELAIKLQPVKEMFSSMWDGIGKGVAWFKALITPVKESQEELAKLAKSGESFGLIFGKVLTALLNPIDSLLKGFSLIREKVGEYFGITSKDSPVKKIEENAAKLKLVAPNIELPKIELPKIELPKIELPNIELPSVLAKLELPTIELPTIELPTIELPTILDKLELPSIELPTILDKLELPSIELPTILDKLELPSIELPSIELPTILDKLELHNVSAKMELPNIELPKVLAKIAPPTIELPSIEQPDIAQPIQPKLNPLASVALSPMGPVTINIDGSNSDPGEIARQVKTQMEAIQREQAATMRSALHD